MAPKACFQNRVSGAESHSGALVAMRKKSGGRLIKVSAVVVQSKIGGIKGVFGVVWLLVAVTISQGPITYQIR